MGILADHTKEISQVIQETAKQLSPSPRENSPSVSVETPNLRPSTVLPAYEPVRTVQTKDRIATAEVRNFSDNPMKLKIIPMLDNEVYAMDIVNSDGQIVYSVNAHSGQFVGHVPLPKGSYQCFIKTQKGDMPMTVVTE